MISRILIFLGIVLFILPTWLYLHYFTSPNQSVFNRVKESVRILGRSLNVLSRDKILISFFQRWGLLWLLTGIAIAIFDDKLTGVVFLFLVILIVFIIPIYFLFLAKGQSKVRSNETESKVR